MIFANSGVSHDKPGLYNLLLIFGLSFLVVHFLVIFCPVITFDLCPSVFKVSEKLNFFSNHKGLFNAKIYFSRNEL